MHDGEDVGVILVFDLVEGGGQADENMEDDIISVTIESGIYDVGANVFGIRGKIGDLGDVWNFSLSYHPRRNTLSSS